MRRRLAEAIEALAEGDREVFLLREIAGLSYAEIAIASDLTEDAVRSRLHRARQQLREALSGTIGANRSKGIRLGGERS